LHTLCTCPAGLQANRPAGPVDQTFRMCRKRGLRGCIDSGSALESTRRVLCAICARSVIPRASTNQSIDAHKSANPKISWVTPAGVVISKNPRMINRMPRGAHKPGGGLFLLAHFTAVRGRRSVARDLLHAGGAIDQRWCVCSCFVLLPLILSPPYSGGSLSSSAFSESPRLSVRSSSQVLGPTSKV
jgi:hypothetical protein